MRWKEAVAVAFALACGVATWTHLDGVMTVATRAPAPRIAGLAVGATPGAELLAAAAREDLVCQDASLMAAMRRAHAQHGVDAAPKTGGVIATALAHARYLGDPTLRQVRVACAGAPARLLGAGRPGSGRLLLVADRGDAPLRSLSFASDHRDAATALAYLRGAAAALEAELGAPTERQGAVPADGATLGYLAPVRRVWRRGGQVVTLTAIDLGRRGVSVTEEVALATPLVVASR